MPTNRTRRSRRHSGVLTPYQAQELLYGPDSVLLRGLGFGGLEVMRIAPELLRAERELAWFRHRDELMAAWEAGTAADLCAEGEHCRKSERAQPWAAEQFEGGRNAD